VAEKGDFQWELQPHRKITPEQLLQENIQKFIEEIMTSDKVTDFIKKLDHDSLLEHFRLIDDGAVTNLGLLWLGNHMQRSKLSYPVTVQYIVYNQKEEKVRKEEWHFNHLNPKELLLEIEEKATELKYFYELPNGLFREKIRQYSSEVVRELLINAFAHKSYTISGDIFIRVYHDRMEIMSPGGLPLGVTSSNILHQTRRKNPYLIDIFKAMGLMEGEGSGYDLIYEKLSQDAKPYPEIESDIDYVKVTIYSNIISQDILKIIDYAQMHFDLTQKEIIVLGIIAREKKINAVKLTKILQLSDDARLRNWVTSLLDKGLLITQGATKATAYLINTDLLQAVEQNIEPSLKTLEPHALKALIFEDLKIHPKSKASEIQKRLPEISLKEVSTILYKAANRGELQTYGGRRNRTYGLANKK
jgi:ATP-dependent DNA helicase RecG